MSKKLFVVVTILMVAAMLLASCQKAAEPTAAPAAATDGKVKVFAAFATPIEEPWDGVIHQALQKAADRKSVV